MFALTLWPEWAWAICAPDKRVENRTWLPHVAPGAQFAIHAGAYIGGRRSRVARDEGVGVVLHVACAGGWCLRPSGLFDGISPRLRREDREIQFFPEAWPTSAIVAVVTYLESDRRMLSSWDARGALHWRIRLEHVLREPIPCHGAQGFWRLRDADQDALAEQLWIDGSVS